MKINSVSAHSLSPPSKCAIICLIAVSLVCLLASGMAADSEHEATGEYNGSHDLPIDPVDKTILAVILTALTVVAFATIMEAIGKTGDRVPRGANAALWGHRLNGYLFIVLAVIIAQFCIRLLAAYGHSDDPLVSLHMMTAIPVVLLPIMKAVIARRYRVLYRLLLPMGITLILLTWITTSLIIIYFFFE